MLPAPPPASFDGSPPRSRILVAEDDPPVLRAYERILRQAGYQVEAVSEGRAAAAQVAAGGFDAILTDLALPDLDGIELLRRVRAHDSELPVVIITGVPAASTAIQALEYGALRYLLKPCSQRQLQEVVAEAVRVRQLNLLKNAALAALPAERIRAPELEPLELRVNRAIDSLWIAYQPIVRLRARDTFAFEALLRTQEPTLREPVALIEAAARLGQLHRVARLIRARVAEDLPRAPAEHLFVNVHPRDLLDEELYDPRAPLSRHARRVVLEITERCTLSRIPDLAARLASLRNLGYRIAVDDLGAGYAGLNYFAELQPDVVKIDMSLVRDVHRYTNKRVLVTALKAACDALDIAVIAEGVESLEERDTVASAGCNLLQGYLFAKPGPDFPRPRWLERDTGEPEARAIGG